MWINNNSLLGNRKGIELQQKKMVKTFDCKEEILLWIKHVPGDENDANLFTKNLPGLTFKKMYEYAVELMSINMEKYSR